MKMLTLTMMHDSDIALKFKATIHILFIFGRIIASIIRIRPSSKYPLFSTTIIFTHNLYIFLNHNLIVYITAYLSEESVVTCQTNSEF